MPPRFRQRSFPGETARLTYTVFDDSGKTSERLAVRDRSDRVVAKWATGLRRTIATNRYSVSWHVPNDVAKKGLKFCLAAYDPSGNQTPPRCAPLVVKP